ncbi:caspase recruitment domain-containing protein 8 isoform X3 [Silurus asotus]|uniref:Caspase recruitment domain-containing protein 8 isoform X3 n=1 Tax=Silurus asotus TaxID=30991 RepID=A0AAD5FMV7_SILAS|nr:caspase recruitment domain-containing protein 8 isoform X3 [Silurus asotus]
MKVGVIGVLECDLMSIHNKKDFDQSEEYMSCKVKEEPNDSDDVVSRFQKKHKQECHLAAYDLLMEAALEWRMVSTTMVERPEPWNCALSGSTASTNLSGGVPFHPLLQRGDHSLEESPREGASRWATRSANHGLSVHLGATRRRQTPSWKKKAQALDSKNTKKKKARIIDLDDMPDLSTRLTDIFVHDIESNKVECKDIKASLKCEPDVIDKNLLKNEKISQTTQNSSDDQQNYKSLYLQIIEAMRYLQDKLKKIIKQEGVDTKMDSLKYKQWKNCCDSLQNDLEEIKTENEEISIQDCAALSTETSITVKGDVLQTWKDETQDRSQSGKGQNDEIQSHIKLRELRQSMTCLLVPYVPALELEQVQKQHQSSTYIPCSSTCLLIPGKKYRPLCEPYASQPKAETFGYDYGPNFHPTFEVIFNTEVEDLTLGLLNENGQEVWEPRQVLFTDADFVDIHRDMLIQRVLSVNEIADTLLTKRMISNETYSDIRNAATSQEKMRTFYRSLNSGGKSVKAEFYKVLKEKEHYLVNDLLSRSTYA